MRGDSGWGTRGCECAVQGMMGGDGVEGMASWLRRIAASGWAGGEWARAGWVNMLFSARMDGIGPLLSLV